MSFSPSTNINLYHRFVNVNYGIPKVGSSRLIDTSYWDPFNPTNFQYLRLRFGDPVTVLQPSLYVPLVWRSTHLFGGSIHLAPNKYNSDTRLNVCFLVHIGDNDVYVSSVIAYKTRAVTERIWSVLRNSINISSLGEGNRRTNSNGLWWQETWFGVRVIQSFNCKNNSKFLYEPLKKLRVHRCLQVEFIKVKVTRKVPKNLR